MATALQLAPFSRASLGLGFSWRDPHERSPSLTDCASQTRGLHSVPPEVEVELELEVELVVCVSLSPAAWWPRGAFSKQSSH